MRLAALALLAAALPAQERPVPSPRAFLFEGHDNLVVVEFAKMRELGIWEDLEASVLKLAFGRIEDEMGFPFAALDRFTVAAAIPDDNTGENFEPRNTTIVQIFEGNRRLPLHDAYRSGNWSEETVAGFDVRHRDLHRDEMLVKPRPDLLVLGNADVVTRALQQPDRRTASHPEVLSLLSGREPRLAYVVLDVRHPVVQGRFLGSMLGANLDDWPDDDRPAFLTAQVLVTGDEDDPHVLVRTILRHQKAGEGVAVSERVADTFLQSLRQDERFRMLRPTLKRVTKKVDGTEVRFDFDLGRSRTAVGQLAALMLPIMARDGAGARPASAPAGERDKKR